MKRDTRHIPTEDDAAKLLEIIQSSDGGNNIGIRQTEEIARLLDTINEECYSTIRVPRSATKIYCSPRVFTGKEGFPILMLDCVNPETGKTVKKDIDMASIDRRWRIDIAYALWNCLKENIEKAS